MDGRRFIRTIRLQNILSYGPDTPEFDLQPLNVLIGPNASGKSNLIEALSLLTAAPRDLLETIRLGGGTREWLWKGCESFSAATIEVTIENLQPRKIPIRYRLSFRESGQRFELVDEVVEEEEPQPGHHDPYSYYNFQKGDPVLNVQGMDLKHDGQSKRLVDKRYWRREKVSLEKSILSQRSDPYAYPELTYLGDRFIDFRFYREWDVSNTGSIRSAQAIDQIQDFLLENASNFGLVLNNLFTHPPIKKKIMEHIKSFYPLVDDIVPHLRDGTVQIQFHESGLNYPIPSSRLSDGTLRYLCLLTVLCNPDPPPVICIEEPETGLHPDIIPGLGELLIEASKRSQIIVTTHSEMLVDALTEVPESIVICEKPEMTTRLYRLNRTELKPWLEKYRLGDLWTSGELGGNRW